MRILILTMGPPSLAFDPVGVGVPREGRLPTADADADAARPAADRLSFRTALGGLALLSLFLYAGSNGGALPAVSGSAVYFAEANGGKPLSPTGKPLPKKAKGETRAEHVAAAAEKRKSVKAKQAKKAKQNVDENHVITHAPEVKVQHVDTTHHEVVKFDEARTSTENAHATHKGKQLTRGKALNADYAPVFTPATSTLIDVDAEDAGPQTGVCTDAAAGPVLDGADVVAYRSLASGANATYGSAENAATYAGYTFYFATAANRAAFEEDPARFAPKFGGFCSYGISDETFWTKSTLGPFSNPNVWRVVDDRLLVFMYCTPEHKFFSQNVTSQLERGNRIWDTWWSADEDPVFNTACFWASKMEGGAQDADSTKYDCVE